MCHYSPQPPSPPDSTIVAIALFKLVRCLLDSLISVRLFRRGMAFEYQLVVEVILFSMLFQGIVTTHIPRFFRGRPRGREGMLGSPNVKRKVDLPVEQWFTQRLTHFNDANRATWRQRYWYNSTNWKKGGPVFLMIGGEGKANPIWMVEGTWTKYANEFGAFTFMLEHRYYGLSHPTV